MKTIRFLKRLSDMLFIPVLISVVCIVIFKDELNTLKYAQVIRYILLAICVIVLTGILLNEKGHDNKHSGNFLKNKILKLLFSKMQKEFYSKKYAKEIKTLNWIILINPIAFNYNLRGDAFELNNENRKAIEDYTRAINISPDIPEYYASRAYMYSKEKQYDKAIEDYTKALLKDPNNDGYMLYRAQAYDNLGNYGKAIEEYDKVLNLNPNEEEAYIGKGVCLSCLERYKEAIDVYLSGLEVSPDSSVLYQNIGVALSFQKENMKALEYYDKALCFDPKNSYAMHNKAVSLYHLDRLEDAMSFINNAININPNNPDEYIRKGNIYLKMNQPEKANQSYLKAKELGGNVDECLSKKVTTVRQKSGLFFN